MAIELIEDDDFVKQLRDYARTVSQTIPDVKDPASARQAAVICISVLAIQEKADALEAIFKRARRKQELRRRDVPFDVAELRPFTAWVPRSHGLS